MIKIICISASNTKSKGGSSTSTRVCDFIKENILQKKPDEIMVETVPLMNYELKNCTLCGSCFKTGKCILDPEFNRLMEQLSDAAAYFIVIPHYSPIPSKLLMVFEKMNEITYAGWINDPDYQSPLYNKPVGLIGHGGMVENEDTLRYYHDHLLTPVANTLRSLSLQVVKSNTAYENGAAFGLKDDTCIRTVENAVFPEIVQDWPKIEERLEPLIDNVLFELRYPR